MSSDNVRRMAARFHATLDNFVVVGRPDVELAVHDLIQARINDLPDCSCKVSDSWADVCKAVYAATDNLEKRDALFSAFNVFRDLAAKKIRSEING